MHRGVHTLASVAQNRGEDSSLYRQSEAMTQSNFPAKASSSTPLPSTTCQTKPWQHVLQRAREPFEPQDLHGSILCCGGPVAATTVLLRYNAVNRVGVGLEKWHQVT